MEGATCDICFTVYSEVTCVPKVLECGHTICLKCLENFLKDQKICPTCRKTLTKSLDEYLTNFIVLKINASLKEKIYPDHQEVNSLTDKFNFLLSREETKNWIDEEISSLKSELVTSTEQKYSTLKKEFVASTEQKYSTLKNEFLTSTEQKFSSLKNELVTTSEESISSLKNELMTTSEESISSLKNEITGRVENFEKLIHEKFELSDAVERRDLMEEIDRHSEVKKKIHYSCYRKEGIMLQLSQYKSEKHFLYDLVVRLHNDEKIYACEFIGVYGWRYGEITFSENRIHIHCLSSDTIGNDVFVVALRDLRKCFGSKEDILPFIEIGNEKLIFTLTQDLSIETLHLIKVFTGEGGQIPKGIKVGVGKLYPEKKDESGNNCLDSLDLNCCNIPLTTTINLAGYENALYEKRFYEINKDDVVLVNVNEKIFIYKVPELKLKRGNNVVGKLHKDFQIDFNKMLNNEVQDSGICFSI